MKASELERWYGQLQEAMKADKPIYWKLDKSDQTEQWTKAVAPEEDALIFSPGIKAIKQISELLCRNQVAVMASVPNACKEDYTKTGQAVRASISRRRSEKLDLLTQLGLSESTKYVIFVGEITRNYARKMAQRYRDKQFVFLGKDGEYCFLVPEFSLSRNGNKELRFRTYNSRSKNLEEQRPPNLHIVTNEGDFIDTGLSSLEIPTVGQSNRQNRGLEFLGVAAASTPSRTSAAAAAPVAPIPTWQGTRLPEVCNARGVAAPGQETDQISYSDREMGARIEADLMNWCRTVNDIERESIQYQGAMESQDRSAQKEPEGKTPRPGMRW